MKSDDLDAITTLLIQFPHRSDEPYRRLTPVDHRDPSKHALASIVSPEPQDRRRARWLREARLVLDRSWLAANSTISVFAAGR
jgi:hypothetical protein